jgi:hypothetical protein
MKQKKTVKAWAVVCPDGGYVWAFEHKDAAIESAISHDEQWHGSHSIVRCTITYSLPQPTKKHG